MQITDERRKRVIDLYFNQHKTYAEIAQIEHISPRDIHAIIKEEEARRQKYKDHQQSAETYKLFSEGKTRVQVAIGLNLPASKVSKLYIEYWKMRGLDVLNTIYKETNGKLWPFLKLYKELIKKRGMSKEQVAKVVEIAIHKLPYMETLYRQIKDEVNKLQYTRQGLVNDIEARKHKISLLDTMAFSCEQDCKRTEQRVQELTAQKDSIEKLIACILNNDNKGYSKLKHIIKETVKAVLSDNKILISISFAAVIQTLKTDPQMVNLIQNMTSANDGEQYKDKDNSITQNLESNKENLLNLAEKNYENLVEELTNDAINTAATSSNPTLSLPRSSSTLQNSFNQSDTYRIEESESFHNSKGDIAD